MDLKSCTISIVSALAATMTLIYEGMMCVWDKIYPSKQNIKCFQKCFRYFCVLLWVIIAVVVAGHLRNTINGAHQWMIARPMDQDQWIKTNGQILGVDAMEEPRSTFPGIDC